MLLLRTLLSHYRLHPVQGVFLLLGITVANVLLVGTLLINAQARASYAGGEQVLRARPVGSIVSRTGAGTIPEREYFALRREGFSNLAPLLRKFVRMQNGERVELLGVDALAMPRSGEDKALEDSLARPASGGRGFADLTLPPYSLWGSAARLEQLGWREGDAPVLDDGRSLPPVVALQGEGLGHRLVLDIGVLQTLTESNGKVSEILVFESTPDAIGALQAALPDDLKWVEAGSGLDPEQLTRSFHLNLAAMGLLAFVVGVFLIYNALAFSYTDRHELLRKLRLAGVSRDELRGVLLLELGLFVVAGCLLGFALGSWLATRLLPGVGLTLAQLYGVYIAYPDGLIKGGIGLPLIMTAVATGLCILIPLRQALNMPLLERQSAGWQLASTARRDRFFLTAGLALLALAAILAAVADTLWLALACMASLLLGAALCLPLSLRLLIGAVERLAPRNWPRLGWLLADCRWLLGPASLALMAITLALVANSGLNTMISSFRQATDSWLQQRLVAGLYLTADLDEAPLQQWLGQHAPATELVSRHATQRTVQNPVGDAARIEIVALPGRRQFLDGVQLIGGADDAKPEFSKGAGVLVSERAMRLDGWRPGQQVQVCPGSDMLPLLGVYRDYGNPQSQWLVSEATFKACWPELRDSGFGIIGPDATDWSILRSELVHHFGYSENEVIDQRELMERGLSVFDRTFAVTRALNALTLLVAGIGIFCAVSAIRHHRTSQQALLTVLGLSRRERAGGLLLQWGLLGLFCIVLVVPFGALLAWVLAAVVTPVAFGWSFALRMDWNHLPMLVLLASSALMLAVLLPSLQLLRASPGHLLREQPV